MKSSSCIGAIIMCIFFISGQATSNKEQEEFKPYFSYNRTQETIEKIKDSLSGYTALVDTIQLKSNLSSEYKINVIHQTNIPENAQITIQLTGTDIR